MVVIDRSGSMLGPKLEAARNAAQLYVDSWRTGDKLGVISFANTPSTDMLLTDWTDAPAGGSRQTAITATINLVAAGGTIKE